MKHTAFKRRHIGHVKSVVGATASKVSEFVLCFLWQSEFREKLEIGRQKDFPYQNLFGQILEAYSGRKK